MGPNRARAYRRVLAGACFFRYGRWLSADTSAEDLAALERTEERRLVRNRRQRERMRVRREADAFEAYVASLSPWTQARRYGRTATVTARDGWIVPVNYRRTYGPSLGGAALTGLRRHEAVGDLLDTLQTSAALHFGGSVFGEFFVKRWLGWRKASEGRRARRNMRNLGGNGPDVAESVRRLAAERRKVNRRATIAACPEAADIRVAWAFVREDPEGPLRLGGLLLDLECYVDNSLVVEERPEGRKIRARSGGIRAWLRQNCPELVGKYKTLMRHKALARKFRQAVEVPDPVPTDEVLGGCRSAEDIVRARVHEQPRFVRGGDAPSVRFAWERSPWRVDADGRPYRGNSRYVQAWFFRGGAHVLAPVLESARRCAGNILASVRREGAARAEAVPSRRQRISDLVSAIEFAVAQRERWWSSRRESLR